MNAARPQTHTGTRRTGAGAPATQPDGEPPLLLCAIAADEHAADVVGVAQHLADVGGYESLYVHIAAEPVPSRLTPGVLPGAGFGPHLTGGAMDDLRRQAVEEGAGLFDALGVRSQDDRHLAFGDPATELLKLADERRPAAIVTGSRGRGPWAAALLGSVTQRLVSEAGRPVLAAQDPAAFSGTGRIVCGIDMPVEQARAVVKAGGQLALRLGRALTVAHVVDDHQPAAVFDAGVLPADGGTQPRARAVGDQLLDDIRPVLPPEVDVELVRLEGPPASRLGALAQSSEAPAIVVGSRGLGTLRTLLEGSVSLDLLHDDNRSVLIVPSPAEAGERDGPGSGA